MIPLVVPLLPPRVVAPWPTRVPLSLLRVLAPWPTLLRLVVLRLVTWGIDVVAEPVVRLTVLVVLRLTCGVEVLRLEVLRLTCGVEVLRLEVLRLTCGVAELRLMLEPEFRLTVGADELLDRETAADWLLLALPPCERPRPWAEASDALKIMHPMRARLIIMVLTEVFIIV